MIHYFPLEPDEQRWTGFMDRAITAHLDSLGEPALRYDRAQPWIAELEAGAFYSAPDVIRHRSVQIADFAYEIAHGQGVPGPKSGDMLFFTDLLVPGVEAIAYMLHLAGMEMQIRGLVHAGSFTDHDMMNPVERWAGLHENAVFDVADKIYVGSSWIKDDIISKRLVDPAKVIVTGFPLDDLLPQPYADREPIVVFNGRHSPEKQPWLFRKLKHDLAWGIPRDTTFVDCLEQRMTKTDYYDLLARAKVVVSFALQETFGTGIQEAVKLGCVPVLPARCCYLEQFPAEYLYDTYDEAADLVREALMGTGALSKVPLTVDCTDAVERWFA